MCRLGRLMAWLGGFHGEGMGFDGETAKWL